MPANYVVVEAKKHSDKPDRGYGPMQTIRLKLRNEQGAEKAGVDWYTKASTEVPQAGAQLFGDVTQTDYGWSFKKARTAPSGGFSRDFKADPVKQAAIAMEAAQKTSVAALVLLAEHGDWKPTDEGLSTRLTSLARVLYEQIQQAMGEAGK